MDLSGPVVLFFFISYIYIYIYINVCTIIENNNFLTWVSASQRGTTHQWSPGPLSLHQKEKEVEEDIGT